VCSTVVWTHGLAHARQVLYHLSHVLSPCFCIWHRVSLYGLELTILLPLISKITGMNYHVQLNANFIFLSAADQSQNYVHAGQVLSHWATLPAKHILLVGMSTGVWTQTGSLAC
jgi:hypothetical protein